MAQIINGIRRLFNVPIVFDFSQTFVGGHSYRKKFVEEIVRPFAGANILDIGCGTGIILDYLPNTIKYIGVDLNPKYISDAQKKYKGRAQFFCANVNEISNLLLKFAQFDIVMAIGVLHHLDDNEAIELFKEAYRHLINGGVFITIDCVIVPNQSWIARFIISKDRGQNVRTPEGYTRLAKNHFNSVETFILDDLLRIPYNHCILRITKE